MTVKNEALVKVKDKKGSSPATRGRFMRGLVSREAGVTLSSKLAKQA